MKQMNSFRKWLSAVNGESTSLQRRLAALTRLSLDQVNSAAAFNPWYIWEAGEPASAS